MHLPKGDAASRPVTGSPGHERQFEALNRAIGRFGMRIFTPYLIDTAHWHGHVEVNFLTGASMTSVMDTDKLEIPEARLVLFRAGLPHQLTRITATGPAPVKLANIYLPVDTFLFMPHIALLGGVVAAIPPRCAARRRCPAGTTTTAAMKTNGWK